MHIRQNVTCALLLAATLAAGCSGGGGGGNTTPVSAPAGLTERDVAVVYSQGAEIVPDTLSIGGGPITQCSISPPLPAGLSLDPQTCAISGTPNGVSPDTIYTINASNAAGSESIKVEIEVKAEVVPPESLSYLNAAVIYTTNAAIIPNTPIATGGEITLYSISPALPAGLQFDPQTGVISGTPLAVSPPAVYTVTGSNSADFVETQLTIEVHAVTQPPASLSYWDLAPIYVVGHPISYDEPQSTGDEITSFSVSPALPAGLSLNPQTGAISGTPTTAQPPTTYTFTGSNSAGSVTVQIVIGIDEPATGAWTPAGSMSQGRFRHTATLLSNGQVLVAGGQRRQVTASTELYDPVANTWTLTGGLSQARQSHSATLLPNGHVLVAGGFKTGVGSEQSSAELYDPASGSWSSTGSMSDARDAHTATLLPNGLVLVAGGEGKSGTLSSAELYNPATGTWSPTGSMAQARFSHTATLLGNGLVLVVGGATDSGVLASAELYNPSTGTWSPTGSMSQVRTNFATALLPDGTVLAIGGTDGNVELSSVERYVPAGTWTPTGSLIHARDFLSATLLPNGRVLAAAGLAGSDLYSDELYDPATGTWTPTASLSWAREQHTATLLGNGSVLITGGLGRGILAHAELFH
ncbi:MULTISPECIES: kelch repeat-containing protein [unclassified Paraburkholderia]|uniref:kelch repeat-containing protein n=1 Tax=unclassified Paraburkholderia TaxID=2615204 RepID=UPI002AB7BC10|nr:MULTISPECIES: kelch repeat-containing protein [unclassified Paraburkholderia]